jgi:hypothetical protein
MHPQKSSEVFQLNLPSINWNNVNLETFLGIVGAFDVDVDFGTGLAVEGKIAGVGVEIGGKKYYNITTLVTTGVLTESLDFSADASVAEELQVGGEITWTVEAHTRELLETQGFAGITVGDYVLGWADIPNSADFFIDLYSLGGYLGVGGEVNVSVNLSEVEKQMDKIFD